MSLQSVGQRLILPPGKILLGGTIVFWVLVLITYEPVMPMGLGLFLYALGLCGAVTWFVWMGVWLLGLVSGFAEWNSRNALVAIAPALVAAIAILLLKADVPMQIRFGASRAELERMAKQVLASPGASYADDYTGPHHFTQIRAEGGGFMCEAGGAIKEWGYAYFPAGVALPSSYFFESLGGGWYYWRD